MFYINSRSKPKETKTLPSEFLFSPISVIAISMAPAGIEAIVEYPLVRKQEL